MAFIKLNREVVYSDIFADNDLLAFYVKLILKARFMPGKDWASGLDRGQLISSLRKLADEFGFSVQHTRTLLSTLEATHLIEVVKGRSNSIITIINYDCGDDLSNNSTQLATHDQHTDQHTNNTASLLNIERKNFRKQEPRAQEKKFSDSERRAALAEEFGERNVAEYEQRFELWKSRQSRPVGVSCYDVIGKWMRGDGVSKPNGGSLADDSSFDTGGIAGRALDVYRS